MRFLYFALDYIFRTSYFTRKFGNNKEHVCSSLISWLYYTTFPKFQFNNKYWTSCDPDDIDDDVEKGLHSWEIIKKYNC